MEHLDIVKLTNSESFERQGSKILDDNEFFQYLVYMMNNNVFKKFYSKFCKDSGDITIIIIYMRLYHDIEKLYMEQYNKQISSSLMVKILHDIFMDSKLRKCVLTKYSSIKY